MSTPAIVLATFRYRESSKIVRLATLELGVQSVIAKGALRPKSRFGASLQLLSEGSAIIHYRDRRDLQTLTAFDPSTVRIALAENLAAFATASVLAEMMLRFSPSERHPESYHLVRRGLEVLEASPPEAVDLVCLRLLWQLVSVLGFAPEMTSCVRDGAPVPDGAVAFSPGEGGVLCRSCAGPAARLLPSDSRTDLVALLDGGDLPIDFVFADGDVPPLAFLEPQTFENQGPEHLGRDALHHFGRAVQAGGDDHQLDALKDIEKRYRLIVDHGGDALHFLRRGGNRRHGGEDDSGCEATDGMPEANELHHDNRQNARRDV